MPELICTVNVATSAGWLYFSAGVVFLYTRVARFVKREYRQTTSASRLVSELGWQSLAKRCKTSRLTLLYKAWWPSLWTTCTSTPIKVYSALWTRHIYHHAITCGCLQVFFFFLKNCFTLELPSQFNQIKIICELKTALRRLSGITRNILYMQIYCQ